MGKHTSNRWVFCLLNFLILTLDLHGSNMIFFFGHGGNDVEKFVSIDLTTR